MPEFMVDMRVQGRMSMTITADSKEEADEKVSALVNDDMWEPDLDEADDVDWTISEFIPVIRDGKRIKTTYVRAGDERVEA